MYINTICKYDGRRNRKEIRGKKTEIETDENEITKKRRMQMKRKETCECRTAAVEMVKIKKK